MTKTNFAAKTDAVLPRARNVNRKKARGGFAEILDRETQPEPKPKPKPAATIEARRAPRKRSRYDAAPAEFGNLDDLKGPTGTVIAEMKLRAPKGQAEDPAETAKRQTLPYAQTRGTFVRFPTFADLGGDAPPEEAPAVPSSQAYSDDPWLPPAPTWGQSRGPDPELVQTPPEEVMLATALEMEFQDEEGELPLVQELGWEALEPDADPLVDLDDALGAFEMALTVQDDAAPVEDASANFAPIADFDGPAASPDHSSSFLSAVPTVSHDAGTSYGSDGNVFTSADPEGAVARNVEVLRTALNRAAITVDTADGQIELAITTAGKHVMVEATAVGGFTDAIQRDIDALREALDRHDLELTELSFGGNGADADTPNDSEHPEQRQPPSIVPTPEQGERDLGFVDDGRQTWVIPTGFRVVA
ncbi:MAG: hypothetical protein ACRBN8_22905 [Nannocystales bacterium]